MLERRQEVACVGQAQAVARDLEVCVRVEVVEVTGQEVEGVVKAVVGGLRAGEEDQKVEEGGKKVGEVGGLKVAAGDVMEEVDFEEVGREVIELPEVMQEIQLWR